jgi:hypothetical protein
MRSLQARLFLALVPITVFVLVLTGLVIERTVRRDLEAGFDHRLLLLAQGLSSALNVQIDGSVEFELDADDKAELRQSTQGAFFAVADERGAVLFSSDPPPSDLFGAGLPFYDTALPQRVQDIDKAKSLLKAAGHSDLKIQLSTSPIFPGPRTCPPARRRARWICPSPRCTSSATACRWWCSPMPRCRR